MTHRLVELTRGREVTASVGAAATLGLLLVLAPGLDRVLLLVASTAALVALGALIVWLVRDHHDIEWTTSAGTAPRVRGSDRRITALARTIDSGLAGDVPAQHRVQSVLGSLAEARLAPHGLSLAGSPVEAEAALGRDLTAYLTSPTPRHLTADELASFITTLEEH